MAQDKPVFSIDAIQRCSGSATNDPAYARFIAAEAIRRATAANLRLEALADLQSWGDNVRAEVDSLAGEVSAMAHTLAHLEQFFGKVPPMKQPFTDVMSDIATIKQKAATSKKTILEWLDAI